MMTRMRCLRAVAVLVLASPAPAARTGWVLLPWDVAGAEKRQVVRIAAEAARADPVARFRPAPSLAGLRLRIVDASAQLKALPLFRDGDGTLSVRVPGKLGPTQARYLIVYGSPAADWSPSPTLGAPPQESDDFASAAFGDAWDFNEADLENITTWGNRPTEYGDVSVRDGKLIIPVTGNDPYFIWGVMFGRANDPHALHVDSRRYRVLRLRVRQSCKHARWTLFVTDAKGRYRSHDFRVNGTGWQEFTFDLADLFSGFWDGREFRALRLDPTNDSPGATVAIDWVKLLPAPVAVQPGPVFSRDQVRRRARCRRLRAQLSETVEAGAPLAWHVEALDGAGKRIPQAPVTMGRFQDDGRFVPLAVSHTARGATIATGTAGDRAGTFPWCVGICDDLGRPAPPLRHVALRVLPAAVDHYELIPANRLVRITQPEVKLSVWAADRFGNHRPVDIQAPRWSVSGGGKVDTGNKGTTHLRGAPAQATIRCPARPLTRHVVTLRDSQGRLGRTEIMTMELKQHPVVLTPTGYLATLDRKLFLPLGGFYANWPAGQPDAAGKIKRSVDLFPCGPKPYPHGYPWLPDVEQKVNDYLDFCHRHGVTALRLMLRNMDLVGRVDPVQLKAVLHLFDLARPRGIRFDVVLFEDYNKPPYCNAAVLDKVVLPKYTDAQLSGLPPYRARFLVEKRLLGGAALKYTDPDVLACQKDYLVDLLPYLTGRDEVFCYEFENEMIHPPMSWINEMTAFIRGIDPRTLILGNPGPHGWPEPWRWRKAKCDLFSYHPYNDGAPRADHGAVVFMRTKWAAASGLPRFTGEGGINQNRWQPGVKNVSPEYAMRGVRDQIWLSLCCGANGAFLWVPEHELEVAEFGKVARALAAVKVDLLKMKRRRPDTALVMPDDASANDNAYALGWKLLDLGVDFDAVPAAAAGGYKRLLAAGTIHGKLSSLPPDLFRPAAGYQLACLADTKLTQVLVYLRNTAGGIANQGDGRPCYLRRPKPAQAAIEVVGDRRWQRVRAFDLDTGKEVAVAKTPTGRLVLASRSSHDFVLGLAR